MFYGWLYARLYAPSIIPLVDLRSKTNPLPLVHPTTSWKGGAGAKDPAMLVEAKLSDEGLSMKLRDAMARGLALVVEGVVDDIPAMFHLVLAMTRPGVAEREGEPI